MPKRVEAIEWAHLNARVPRRLHREIKVAAVRADATLRQFIADAIRDKLAREEKRA